MNNDIPWPKPNASFSYILLLISLTILLNSCSKSPEPTDIATDQILQQAKQSDIPVPVGFKPVALTNTTSEKNKTILRYHGNLSTKQIASFYKRSMELNGWNIQDFSTEQEGLLVCDKVHKRCAVSMTKGDVKIVVLESPTQKSVRYYAKHTPRNRDIDIINKKEINIS